MTMTMTMTMLKCCLLAATLAISTPFVRGQDGLEFGRTASSSRQQRDLSEEIYLLRELLDEDSMAFSMSMSMSMSMAMPSMARETTMYGAEPSPPAQFLTPAMATDSMEALSPMDTIDVTEESPAADEVEEQVESVPEVDENLETAAADEDRSANAAFTIQESLTSGNPATTAVVAIAATGAVALGAMAIQRRRNAGKRGYGDLDKEVATSEDGNDTYAESAGAV